MGVGEQVAILYCGPHALMSEIRLDQVQEFQTVFLQAMKAEHQDVLDSLAAGILDSSICSTIEEVARNAAASLE